MSKFYGMVCGNREAATRGESRNSGFHASCQSYDGSVITKMRYVDQIADREHLEVRVEVSEGSSCYGDWNTPEFVGSFDELKKLLQLHKDIKAGRVSIVRHRQPKE